MLVIPSEAERSRGTPRQHFKIPQRDLSTSLEMTDIRSHTAAVIPAYQDENILETSRAEPASGWITFSLLMTVQPIRRQHARAKPGLKSLFTLKTAVKAKRSKPAWRTGSPDRIDLPADQTGKSRGRFFSIPTVNIFPKKLIGL